MKDCPVQVTVLVSSVRPTNACNFYRNTLTDSHLTALELLSIESDVFSTMFFLLLRT